MHEISDEFKIVVVEAICALCLKYPQKYPVLMSFLSTALRDEVLNSLAWLNSWHKGGFEFKRAIVKAITNMVAEIPESRESGLAHLCEYIEDCEHPALLTAILHLLGEQGPRSQQPSKYIRYIYNRLILENSLVRAAAVDALTKFGSQVAALKESIIVLLKRYLAVIKSCFDGL